MKTKKIPLVLIYLLSFSCGGSGSNSTPEDLARECCECWNAVDRIQNQVAQYRKLEECGRMTRNALYDLQEMGVKNDWSDQQVKEARKRFDSVYEKCTTNKLTD